VVDGCRRAASLYEEGREVPLDPDRAAALMQRACTFGDKTACPKGP
jgi:TPR repeat protein